jgi:hypothetical protein
MADYSQMWMGVATPAPTLPTADSGDKDFMVIARKDAKEKESGK